MKPRDAYANAIASINLTDCPVVAVDMPSGVDTDTGATLGEAIRATHTVTFAYPKLGQFLFPGAACVGHLHVVDIGFDWEKLDAQTPFRLFTLPLTKGVEAPNRPSSLRNARECFQAGATGIAAIRWFQDAENLHELEGNVASLREQWGNAATR